MIKLFTTLLLLNVLLYSEPLPISTEFTDWDKVNKDITKKKCISIRKLIFKGFEKGISFKPSQILLWNNHCQALTNFYIYTHKSVNQCIKILFL
ncbi:MAG TPA: hypothetical protein EYG89_04575 [Bacteroidia bacterium]|nr:hypothetical protein [Bacteroidia bacterium]